MKRKSKYIPKGKMNPAFQARQIDKIKRDVDNHRKTISAISRSHDIHISHLANFARHDIKNSIQSMDSILSTTSSEEFNQGAIDSLLTHLQVIRDTIDNFAKLVPYSTTGKFKLLNLMVAVELITRTDMQKQNIEIIYDYPRDSTIEIDLPFQIMLQMMNNLIINALKSLENTPNKKILISAGISPEGLCIKIKDNGSNIESRDMDKIFDYGYSTTGGSGIGLFHARYLCTEFKGHIDVDLIEELGYTKCFSIKLPLSRKEDEKDDSYN